jgi:hypothetical protein
MFGMFRKRILHKLNQEITRFITGASCGALAAVSPASIGARGCIELGDSGRDLVADREGTRQRDAMANGDEADLMASYEFCGQWPQPPLEYYYPGRPPRELSPRATPRTPY